MAGPVAGTAIIVFGVLALFLYVTSDRIDWNKGLSMVGGGFAIVVAGVLVILGAGGVGFILWKVVPWMWQGMISFQINVIVLSF